MKYIVSISGGKDSTATLLFMLNNYPKQDIIPYYIDTKWEHDDVYNYLSYLEGRLGIDIIRIESEGMEALSKRKRMMPNRVMRFCTENLKVKPSQEFYYDSFISKGIEFTNVVGVRRDESRARSKEKMHKIVEFRRKRKTYKVKTYQPIVNWNTQQVFDYIKKHGIDVNPLYKRGAKRVGCYPCIFATTHDLQMMEQKYIDRLRNLEKDMKKIVKKECTFFPPSVDKHLRKT